MTGPEGTPHADRARVVSTGIRHPLIDEVLGEFGPIAMTPDHAPATISAHLAAAEALILQGAAGANAEVIAAGPALRVIARSGVGVDSVDVAAATERGIAVINTPGANAKSVAEAALTYSLAILKNLAHWDTQVKAGNWDSRLSRDTRDIAGATLGIVGLGNVGKQLAALAGALGMRVVAADPVTPATDAAAVGATLLPFAEVLEQADVVSLHSTLTPETRGMINADTLRLMKPDAGLVNFGRGGLVESLDVLHRALVDGKLRGVALDAFDPEPPSVDHPIFRHERMLGSPHAPGNTPSAWDNIFRSFTHDVAAVLRGDPPVHCVNRDVLERR